MIGLGLRLTVSGGREAVIRLVLLVVAVGLGVGLLLAVLACINAVNAQNSRYAWLDTTPGTHGTGPARDPLWGRIRTDNFDGQPIIRVDVAATGPTSPVPPGIPRLPGPGQYYASPALTRLLASTPRDELADRYPGRQAGLVGDAALPAPNSLIIIVGDTTARLSHMPDAAEVSSINTTAPSSCTGVNCAVREGANASGVDLILSVAALALLAPVLIFIATATRLAAARREQRFAAMRLAGATPQQVSLIATMESSLAAVAGTAAGFGFFFAVRTPIAAIPFTGIPFFPGEVSLSLLDIVLVAFGVPLAAAAAARIALRRVHITPLGVARRVTPQAPRAWRLLPLLAGLAELGYFVAAGRPATISGQIWAYLPGFALIMTGLVTGGPWLTMTGAKIMAGRTSRPGGLIAARRLADDPRAGFRAVSGLILALFVTTIAVALIGTQDAKASGPVGGAAATNVLADHFNYTPPGTAAAPSAALLARLAQIPGVQGIVEVQAAPGLRFTGPVDGVPRGMPAGLVSCAELDAVPAFGRCPAGVAAVEFPVVINAGWTLAGITWPAASSSPAALSGRALDTLDVATNGSVAGIEQARTLLENAYPDAVTPDTYGETSASQNAVNRDYQQLADVVILASLPIAGCTLAASVAAGLADRKRPFSLLRLTGAPLGMLRRVVALESAVPLLAVAAVSIGIAFAAAAMYATMEMQHPLVAPGAAYYAITAAGLVASLAIIAATFPLLRRITSPEAARNE